MQSKMAASEIRGLSLRHHLLGALPQDDDPALIQKGMDRRGRVRPPHLQGLEPKVLEVQNDHGGNLALRAVQPSIRMRTAQHVDAREVRQNKCGRLDHPKYRVSLEILRLPSARPIGEPEKPPDFPWK
jgi:hypothetical protein